MYRSRTSFFQNMILSHRETTKKFTSALIMLMTTAEVTMANYIMRLGTVHECCVLIAHFFAVIYLIFYNVILDIASYFKRYFCIARMLSCVKYTHAGKIFIINEYLSLMAIKTIFRNFFVFCLNYN